MEKRDEIIATTKKQPCEDGSSMCGETHYEDKQQHKHTPIYRIPSVTITTTQDNRDSNDNGIELTTLVPTTNAMMDNNIFAVQDGDETLYEAMDDSTTPPITNQNHRQHSIKKEEFTNNNNIFNFSQNTSISNLDDAATDGGLDLEYMRQLSRSNSIIALADRRNSEPFLDMTTDGGLNLEYMRHLSRSNSLIAPTTGGRARKSGPLFDEVVDGEYFSRTFPKRAASMDDLYSTNSRGSNKTIRDEYYEPMSDATTTTGFWQTLAKPIHKSASMPHGRQLVPVVVDNEGYIGGLNNTEADDSGDNNSKEPIYSEVHIYERSLPISPKQTSKHQRSFSLGGDSCDAITGGGGGVTLRKTPGAGENLELAAKLRKKRRSLPPPAKPPRQGSLKYELFKNNDINGSILTTSNLSKASSMASMIGLESFETDYIVCGVKVKSPQQKRQQQQQKQSPPKKPLRSSTENLYNVPRKSPQHNVRSNSTPVVASPAELAALKKQTERTLSVPANRISIVIQNFENPGFENDNTTVNGRNLVLNDNNNRIDYNDETKLTILNQQDRNTGLAGDWGYGCTDDGVYQRMDGM